MSQVEVGITYGSSKGNKELGLASEVSEVSGRIWNWEMLIQLQTLPSLMVELEQKCAPAERHLGFSHSGKEREAVWLLNRQQSRCRRHRRRLTTPDKTLTRKGRQELL